jgi:glycosyltransferase involved in cell wall biosynthesis
VCYETFGRVIIEAYACGKPVIVSDIGAVREAVIDGKTGLLFRAGDSSDLALKARHLVNNSNLLISMENNARQEYESHYTAEKNYEKLVAVYKAVLKI